MTLSCFKAYDIRGKVPSQLNEALARQIGRAYAARFKPKKVVVGYDMRLSSKALSEALTQGLIEMGVDVIDLGLGGTEMVYFASFHLENDGVDGGIVVTASHNPADYNGMKFVQKGAVPISGDSGLREIESLCEGGVDVVGGQQAGTRSSLNVMPAYIEHLLGYVDVGTLKPLKIVADAGNGCAGLVIDALEGRLPFTFTKLHNDPDGTFPNGVPNPLLVENRAATIAAVKAAGADIGIAWDGDFDRCFFFDAEGRFVEGYYMVGLFAEEALRTSPGASIIHDPRLTWNTIEKVGAAGGVAVQSKTGHAFIKERMRKENAVYGGEMSAHHYFRAFAYCDSGMIPWLLLAAQISRTGRGLADLVNDMQNRFPASGEINLHLDDTRKAINAVRQRFGAGAVAIDETDGISIERERWRLNVRASNTEPVVRVNVESRGDEALMKRKTDEVLHLLRSL